MRCYAQGVIFNLSACVADPVSQRIHSMDWAENEQDGITWVELLADFVMSHHLKPQVVGPARF